MTSSRFVLGVTAAIALLVPIVGARAAQHAGKKQTFEDSRLFIEYNSSGPDIGVQIQADAEEWRSLKIFDPRNRKLFDVFAKGSVGALGASELFTESGEPSLDELSLDEFLALFPEGDYAFVGETPDGEKISGRAHFTHVLPDPPVITGPPAAPQPASNVVVTWQPVPNPAGGQIAMYEVVLEHGDRIFDIEVPASVTSVKIAPEYLQAATHYGFEVIVWEAGGNHTITEGHFDTQ